MTTPPSEPNFALPASVEEAVQHNSTDPSKPDLRNRRSEYNDPDREILPDIIEETILESDPWFQRVADLEQQFRHMKKSSEDADRLFVELGPVLRERLRLLEQHIGSTAAIDTPLKVPAEISLYVHNLQELKANVDQLYSARLTLLPLLSAQLRDEVRGTKLFGAQEVRTETNYALQRIRYQRFAPHEAWKVFKIRTARTPLRLIINVIALGLVLILFRWWRRWFPDTLARIRQSLSTARPRTPQAVRRMKMVWYLEQVRSPLEWLILLNFLLGHLALEPLEFLRTAASIIISWLLVARAIVLLLNAIASRGDAGLVGDEATLRLKSLRLVSAWLLTLGIGLSLIEFLAGEAALHAGVWRIFIVMAVPVLITLLVWWRDSIFARLKLEPDKSPQLEELLKHTTGLRGYTGAASALGFFVADNLQRRLMRRIVSTDISSELGQNGSDDAGATSVVANLLGTDLRNRFLEAGSLYTKYARNERRELLTRINSGRNSTVVVTGVRGIGKSRFISELADKVDGELIQIGCDSGLATNFLTELKAQLGMASREGFDLDEAHQLLAQRKVRVIAIDDAQRLIRPSVGEQQELNDILQALRGMEFEGTWILSIDRYAWRYIVAAQPTRAYADTIIELPPWTEEQISEYINQRCEELDIDPDFSQVNVPRQYLEGGYTSTDERNEQGIIRLLTEFSAGNLSVALRLWSECLNVDDQGRLIGSLPTLESSDELENINIGGLLLLRTITQFERITLDEIEEGLRISREEVETAVRFGLLRGWIEDTPGGLSLSWHWFPVITRLLARQNLLER